ncbi:MAG: hypothetical protein ICV73_22010 [Acetobacteraceae bacterium]|nr:hypothetical protein [Acetobacteraceae bacterium]
MTRALALAAGLALAACAAPPPVDCVSVVTERCYRPLGNGQSVALRADGTPMMVNGRPLTVPDPPKTLPFPLVTRRGAGFWAGRGLAMPAY